MEVKAKILRKEMAAREERRGTEGTGTGGEGEVEFAKRGEGIEEAGDGNTGRGGVPTVELRKSTGGRGRHRRRRWSGVECGAMEGRQLVGVGRAPGVRGEWERECERR